MKKLLCILLILSLAAGCSGKTPEPTPQETTAAETTSGDVFNPPDKQQPSLFGVAFCPGEGPYNPITDTVTANRGYISLVYDGLFALDEGYMTHYRLCESYETSGKTLNIKLRQDARFHDGSPVTAEDVVYSLELAADSDRSGYTSRLSEVVSVEGVDDYTVRITLARERGNFIALLDIPIIRKGSGVSEDAVGCGRYIPIVGDEGGYLIVNTDYYGEENSGDIEYMSITEVADTEALLYAFSASTIDLMTHGGIEDSSGVLADADRYTVNTSRLHFVLFNSKKLTSASVRLALTKAIDRSRVYPSGVHPRTSLFPEWTEFSNEEVTSSICGYDRTSAAELLTEAGYSLEAGYWTDGKGKRLSLTLVGLDDGGSERAAAEDIAAQLKFFGVEVKLDLASAEECAAKLKKGSFDIALCKTRLSADFDFSFLLSSQNSSAFGRLADSELDAVLSSFAAARPGSGRLLAGVLGRAVAEKCPLAVIGYEYSYVYINRRYGISGVRVTEADPFYSVGVWTEGR